MTTAAGSLRRPLGPLGPLAVGLVLLAGALIARADVIHLEGGGKYRGTITKETAREVTIRTAGGLVVVPRRDIASIEKEESAQQEFARREAELRAKDDPDAHFELGRWAAERRGLEAEARRCFERAIALDAYHRGAREALGHRYHQGRWYTEEEYRRVVQGLVEWDGKWVTPEDRARFEQGFVKDADGTWARPEDLARKAEEERLGREAAAPRPAGGTAPAGPTPRPGRLEPPPAADDSGEDKAWYRDNERAGDINAVQPLESKFYRIRTNVKPEYARRYGEMMDRYYVRFLKVFKELMPPGTPGKSELLIYSSQREFMQLEGMGQSVGGFYNTGSKRVTAFHGLFGTTGTTRGVLAHEGTHQFQDIVLQGAFGNAPMWILEGLAVFFESAYYDGEEVVIGLVPRDRLAVLKRGLEQNQLIPLVDLIRTPQPQFTAYHYAHAWGLIYMILYYGESKTVRQRCQEWFSELFRLSRRGRVTAEIVEERCGGREKFLELEQRWKDWLRDLPYDFDPR